MTSFIAVSTLLATGQTTFNKTYEFGYHTLLTNVVEVESGYIGGGFVYDTSGVSYKGYFVKLDSDGNVDNYNSLQDSSEYISIGQDANAFLNDTVMVFAALTFTDSTEHCKVLWINYNGDTLFTRAYSSPYLGINEEADWMRPSSIDVDPQQNIYVTCQIFWPGETSNDFLIMKLSAQGDSLWSYLVNEEGNQTCYDIQAVPDGVIVGSNSVTDVGTQRFFKLDLSGEVEWDIVPEDTAPISGRPNEFVIESDGFVFAAQYSWNWTQWDLPAIVKVDFAGAVLWSIFLQGSMANNGWQPCDHLVKSADGGYLAAAWQYEENPPDPELNGNFNWNAWLIKVSQEGVLEWERFYHFVESTQDKHRVYDLKTTSDGGYIFCGDAIDQDVETNGQVTQRGWLVKVDGCGCLVPGCDVDCTTGLAESDDAEIKYFIFGPNPVQQYLNIYFFDGFPDGEMSIYDLNGRLLESFVPRQGKTTYMLNVTDYAPGIYVVSLQYAGRIVQSEKVVVE